MVEKISGITNIKYFSFLFYSRQGFIYSYSNQPSGERRFQFKLIKFGESFYIGILHYVLNFCFIFKIASNNPIQFLVISTYQNFIKLLFAGFNKSNFKIGYGISKYCNSRIRNENVQLAKSPLKISAILLSILTG